MDVLISLPIRGHEPIQGAIAHCEYVIIEHLVRLPAGHVRMARTVHTAYVVRGRTVKNTGIPYCGFTEPCWSSPYRTSAFGQLIVDRGG